MAPALHQHQAHPDVTLYLLGCLREIARRLGADVPPVPTRWLDDLMEFTAAQEEAQPRYPAE